MVSGIILAGGSSTRYGTGENKTLVELLGRPVLEYSLRVFMAADVVDEVVLAAKAGEEAALRKLAEGLCLQKPVTVVTGGADRAASVENALAAARGEVVLIQDGARPLVTEQMLEDCLAALEEADGATIATPSRDTVKLADEEGYAEATTDRSRTWLIQTPQAFYREKLLTQWLDPAYDSLWMGELSEKVGRYNGLIGSIYRRKDGLRTLMDGYMDAMQTAVYALSALGGVRLLKKKGDMAALALPVTILGGALYHLLFEAKAQYAYPYMVYMLPLAAMGLCALAEKLKKISG
mgnify:CR=1 FL=1